MKKIDLIEGIDIVKTNDNEWSMLDKEGYFVGKIKENALGVFKRTNSLIFCNKHTEQTRYQLELMNMSAAVREGIDARENYYLVNIDFGQYPMIQAFSVGDNAICFKITEDGFVLTREKGVDRKQIMFKTTKNSNGETEKKHYIIKGLGDSRLRLKYSQKNLNTPYPNVVYTSNDLILGTEISRSLPLDMQGAINSNELGKSIFKRARKELNEILPFKEDIFVALLKNTQIPKELLVFVPELAEKAKIKRK